MGVMIISSDSRNAGRLEACPHVFFWVALLETAVHPFLRLCNAGLIYLAMYVSLHKTVTRDMGRMKMKYRCIVLAKAASVLFNEPDR